MLEVFEKIKSARDKYSTNNPCITFLLVISASALTPAFNRSERCDTNNEWITVVPKNLHFLLNLIDASLLMDRLKRVNGCAEVC